MEVGQRYSFEVHGDHPNPYFIVCKIDKDYGKEIISISIAGLKFVNPHSETGFGHAISHAPVELSALSNASIKLVSENEELPDYEEGYSTWREAFESGQGGYFTIPPDKIVEYIVSSILQ